MGNQNDQRRELRFDPAAGCECSGALVADPAVVDLWARRLFAEHPQWSAKRVQQRASIQTLKGIAP
ncbi:MAG TPA: hypothetical protein VLJ58_04910 [Ramlibacter sp.]|nr:hypothetical protein [Ramlibacter sp.]